MGSKTKTRSPSKQRKQIYAANTFKRHKMMEARLSHDLRKKYNVKKAPVHTGDTVYVTAGDFVGTEGKVQASNHKKQKLEIGGISREKADKSKIMYPIHISKIVIRRFGKVDRSRKQLLERRAKKELEIEAEDISEDETLESAPIFEEE